MKYLPLFLIAAEEYKYGTFAEKLALSGRFLLIGMGTVFFVLALLWAILAIFGAVSSSANKKAAAAKSEPVKELPKAEEEPEPAPAAVEEAPASDDNAVIAAICAAIEAYRAEEGKSGLPYRVVSFKRKSGKKSWNGPAED